VAEQPAPISWPVLSSLDLEDLLGEIRSRATSVEQAQVRLGSLLDAVVAISSDLDLPEVLHRIVVAACELVDATYGALGVLGPGGEELVEFVTHGVTPEQRAAIGPLPHGLGLLGLVIRSPRPQRVARIADHPQAHGFPPGHPPMTSFLGTPVRIRDQVFGNIYLTDKRSAEEFSEEDEAFLGALAAAAGVAIENARLFDRTRSQHQWGEVIAEATQALLAGDAETHVLDTAVSRICELTGASACTAALVKGPDLVVAAGHGAATEDAGPVGSAVRLPPWRAALVARDPVDTGTGEAGGRRVLVPLRAGSTPVGVLAVEWATGEPQGTAVAALQDLGQRLAVALTAATAQRERARLEVFQDRDRIARDMHDLVIQRLFATGLSLQAAGRMSGEALTQRLDDAVGELDDAIKDIRQTIFALGRPADAPGLAAEVSRLCSDSAASLGFTPRLRVVGPADDVAGEDVAEVLAVVREGLSNVARHASASRVEVVVEVAEDVSVTVADDGSGLPENAVLSGLDNLRHRAERRQGRFAVDSGRGRTQLHWSVPLRRE
jgi:signal transduction histidine kinase